MKEYIPMGLLILTSGLWYVAGHPKIEKWPSWSASAMWVAGTVALCAASAMMILEAV